MNRYLAATQHGQSLSRVAGDCPVLSGAASLRPSHILPVDATLPMHAVAVEATQPWFAGVGNLSEKREKWTAIT